MAKLAVFLIAAVAISAASVVRDIRLLDSTDDVERFDWKEGNDMAQYLMQLRTISKDVTTRVRDITPTNKLNMKTLNWHCRVLSLYFDSIIEKLEKDMGYDMGVDRVVLKEFFDVLREIQISLRQVDELSVEQLKYTFNMSIEKCVEQIEKLVRLTLGRLTNSIKFVLVDCITMIQNIDYQLKNFGLKELTWVQLSTEIRDLTRDLTKYLRDCQFNNIHVKETLRKYLNHLELLKNQRHLDTILVDNELMDLCDRMYKKLCDIIRPLIQTSKYERFVNTDVLKREFITELETFCEEIDKYVRHFETKFLSTERYWIIENILKNYLFTIHQLKIDLLKDVEVVNYKKDVLRMWGKTDLKKSEFDLDTFKIDVCKQRFGRGENMELCSVVEDLLNYIKNLDTDNVVVKQTLTHLFQVYILNLETIVEKLDDVCTYKNYECGTEVKEIIQNLRQCVLSLKRLLNDEYVSNISELKNHIGICLVNFATDLQKLMVLCQTKVGETSETCIVLKNVIVKFLTATRNCNLYLHNIGQVTFTGQNYLDFASNIQILAHDFVIDLKSLSVDNIMMKDVILTRCHEYSRLVQKIIDMLETKSDFSNVCQDQVCRKVVMNLRQIVDVLERIVKREELSIYKLREVLITCVENSLSEIKDLLLVWHRDGQKQELETVLFRMFHDFMVSLKLHQFQLDQVYYNKEHGQNVHQLSSQIQIITNNLVNYFRNVNTYKVEQKELFVDVIKQELIRCLDLVIQRLQTEVIRMDKSGVYWDVISELKRIVDELREVTKYDNLMRTEYNMHTELHIVLIDIARIFERLSYFTESNMKGNENVGEVIRSVLLHYLMTIKHLQVEFNQVHYRHQIEKTPREMVLTIEIICDRIQQLLRFTVPKTAERDLSLIVYVRNLYNSMGRIVTHLNENKMEYLNDKCLVELVENINKLRTYIEKNIFNDDRVETQELHIHLLTVVDEIKKMFWAVQLGFQHDVVKWDTVVKHCLDTFLIDLEYFEHYLQVSLQFIRGGLTIRDLYHEIEVVIGRLQSLFQYGTSDNGRLRRIIALQVGQFTKTIKNIMLKILNDFPEKRCSLMRDINIELEEICNRLYKFTIIDDEISTQDLAKDFLLCIRKFAVVFQKLENGCMNKIQEHLLMEQTISIKGIYCHYLIALRNIYIQLDTTKHVGLYQENKDLFNQIQIFVNQITTSLQYLDLNLEDVKEYFTICTLQYTHRIHVIIEKLEFLKKSGKINCDCMEKILLNLRQTVVALQELGTDFHVLPMMQLRNLVTTKIQVIHVEFQKLMMLEDVNIDTVVRGIFIDYYSAIQWFQDCVENIHIFPTSTVNPEDLAYYIEAVVYDISYCLRHLTYSDELVQQTFLVEYRKLYKTVDSIIEKFSSIRVGECKKIVDQLKDIQLHTKKFTTGTFFDVNQQRIQLELYLRRVSYIFKQLVWSIRSECQDKDFIDLVYTNLFNFVKVFHTCEIQFLNILGNQYVKEYGIEWNRKREYSIDVLNKNYGEDELLYKRFNPINKYFGEKVYEHLGVGTQNTWGLVTEIKKVVFDLTKIIRDDVTLVKQDVRVYIKEIRKMVFLVDRMVQTLRMQVRDFEGDRMVLNRVIERLDDIVMPLKRVMEDTTWTSIPKLMKELDQFLVTFVEQCDKLVMIGREFRGRFDMDLTKFLEEFLLTLQKFKNLCRYGYEIEHRTLNEDKFTIEELVEQIKMYCTKVVRGVEMVFRGTDSKDVLVHQVRELITILDKIIYKLEDSVKTDKHDVIYQIYVNLKAIQSELSEIVHSDITITVNQIRTQFTLTIRKITENLVELVLNSKYHLFDNTFMCDILKQYLEYLRNIHMKWGRNIENVDMSHEYKGLVSGKVCSRFQLRELTTIVRKIVDEVETKLHLMKDRDLVVLRRVLVKFQDLLKELTGELVTEFKCEHLATLVRGVVLEMKNVMTIFEQSGRDYDMHIWCKDILQEFILPVQKCCFQIKDLVHIWV